jgi:KDO2-lipid IV(A) lauroyltransferase
LRLLSLLPYPLVAAIGSGLGTPLYQIPNHRKHVVLVNLRLCFPAKTELERDSLARAHFQQVMRSYLEWGFQWFVSAREK